MRNEVIHLLFQGFGQGQRGKKQFGADTVFEEMVFYFFLKLGGLAGRGIFGTKWDSGGRGSRFGDLRFGVGACMFGFARGFCATKWGRSG